MSVSVAAPTDAALYKLLDELREDLEKDLALISDETHLGTCCACRESVRKIDEACMVKERYCHIRCFACATCQKSLRAVGYYEDGDAMNCEDCHLDKRAPKCTKCTKPITVSVLTYKEQPYHAACFACDTCNTSLDGKSFFDKGEKRYCEGCHDREKASAAPKCAACTKPIIATTLAKIGDNRFHNECVVCTTCKKALGNDICLRNGRLYCPAHVDQAASA